MGDYDLIQELDVREYEGITSHGDNELLTRIIERVTSRFERFCDRQFADRAYSYLTDPDNAKLDGLNNPNQRQIIALRQYPIISVTTVRINEVAYTESTSIYNSGWFIYSKEAGLLGLRGYEWLQGAQNIELVYTAGYATIPEDLQEACIKQVLWHYKQGKGAHLLGVSGKSLADGSVNLYATNALLPEVKEVLMRYKRWPA